MCNNSYRTGTLELTKVAVIGAGLSGLIVARRLSACCDVTVFEKSRGVGGRIATRYADACEFDHGAQFFTARSPEFQRFLEPLLEAGVIADWQARFAELDGSKVTSIRQWDARYPHFVGAPRMNAIGKWLAADLNVQLETRVCSLARSARKWTLQDDNDEPLGEFDWVVVALPAAQAAALVPTASKVGALAAARRMPGCFALLLGFREPLDLPWQAALVRNADVSWVSVNSSKPGRGKRFTLVIHSTNAWADAHIDDPAEAAMDAMLTEASRVIGYDVSTAELIQLQRWRYANIDPQSGPAHTLETELGLAACGDWFVRGRIEAAFTSGDELAAAMQALLYA